VGALFAPEAYQFFPYFAVAYTSVLLAIAKERESEPKESAEPPIRPQLRRKGFKKGEFTPVR
jgi:hypothetical protein